MASRGTCTVFDSITSLLNKTGKRGNAAYRSIFRPAGRVLSIRDPCRRLQGKTAGSPALPGGDYVKYLCLIYDDEQIFTKMSKTEMDGLMGEYFAFTDAIKKSGHYLGGEALKPIATATTVRVRHGKMSTTDGPFAETKEQLGGYYLIEARDLNDAIQVAAKIPSARLGSIEVRPVEVFG